ncbi:DUF6770 family protein [Rufibacter glacialis]|uniref:DUF6770 family protein n=1 Tax=Rufibacter glacialis TaxID=1259555 RepID=A0A5M8QKG1_9BACT|nr:DUF6770 family protein [Rufibacter glacialis]KAA6434772.1 hypothetical protein FOE74_11405 [Rufibacter glacialis]GGK72285.1 hypothetical protein GCM10011405_20660 [Rufibacter glacialis]
MRKILLSVLFLFLVVISGSAQQAQITGVRKKEFRGVESIKDKGYYTFYVNEKAKGGMVEFMLEIYDLELNQIKKTPILITKNSQLIGGEFNGKDFLFAFSDFNKKQNTFATVDLEGNIIKQETRQNKKTATAGSTAIYASMDEDGFFITQTVKEKAWGYHVEKVDRNLSPLWEKTVANNKGIVNIEAAEAGNGQLLLISAERPGALSSKVTGKIVCLNGQDGAIKYEQPLFDGKVTGIPSAFLIDKEGNVVTAGMYFDGEKWDAVNSDGIFFMKLSPDGKKTAYSTIDWDNGIQNTLKATSRKFSIGSKPKVLFHKIVDTGNGYQIISETFRKTVKAGTVLAMAAGSNPNAIPWGFTVMDYIIFNYDQNGKALDINKIEKPYKSIYVDGYIASMGGVSLAYHLRKYKMFTFDFATRLRDTDQPVIVYSNFEDAGIGKGNPYVGISTIKMGEVSQTTKMPLTKKLSPYLTDSPDDAKTGALLSKPGFVCMYHYDKKSQTINLVLEELKMK